MRGGGWVRVSWLAVPLLLSGCDLVKGGSGDIPVDDTIECAVGGSQAFERNCGVQRVQDDDGALALVVRHPDGGFRRFLVLTDGHGLETADGSEQALIDVVDGRLDVSVGQDRYRFPATVKAADDGTPASQ